MLYSVAGRQKRELDSGKKETTIGVEENSGKGEVGPHYDQPSLRAASGSSRWLVQKWTQWHPGGSLFHNVQSRIFFWTIQAFCICNMASSFVFVWDSCVCVCIYVFLVCFLLSLFSCLFWFVFIFFIISLLDACFFFSNKRQKGYGSRWEGMQELGEGKL